MPAEADTEAAAKAASSSAVPAVAAAAALRYSTCSSRGRLLGTCKRGKELQNSLISVFHLLLICCIIRNNTPQYVHSYTILSLASSNIAMISFGCAHISERGMPLHLFPAHEPTQQALQCRAIHELLFPFRREAVEATRTATGVTASNSNGYI